MAAARATGLVLAVLVLAMVMPSTQAAAALPWAYNKLKGSKNHNFIRYALGVVGPQNLPWLANSTTLLAPDDHAFNVLANKLGLTMRQLRANKPLLTKIVLYHIVPDVGVRDLLRMFKIDGEPKYDQNWWIATALDLDTTPSGTVDAVNAPNSIRMFTRKGGNVIIRGFASATDRVKFLFDDANILTIGTVLIPRLGPYANCKTVAQVLDTYDNFTYIIQAFKSAGYWDDVSKRTFTGTVLAPTNAALQAAARLLKTTVARLVRSPATTNPLLGYHMLSKRYYLSNFFNRQKLTTKLANKAVYADIRSAPGLITIKGDLSNGTIVVPDLFACRAVVHAIDDVLLPK